AAGSFEHFPDKFPRPCFRERTLSRHAFGTFQRKANFQRLSAVRLLRALLKPPSVSCSVAANPVWASFACIFRKSCHKSEHSQNVRRFQLCSETLFLR